MNIAENKDLLFRLIEDLEKTKKPWGLSEYWEPYHRRLVKEIKNNGIESLQSNYNLLEGFGGAKRFKTEVTKPTNFLKKFAFELFENFPGISKVVNEHKIYIQQLNKKNILLEIEICKQALQSIEKIHGPISINFDLDIGNPQDAFMWNKSLFTTSFVKYLLRASDFYKNINSSEVNTLMEIGPGLGWSTLAHKTLNPNLKFFINIDIPATLYLSTQFLKATSAFDIFDYDDFLKNENNIFNNKSDNLPTCLLLPPWCYPKINKKIDWLHNAYSFKEMDAETIKAYAEHSKKIITKGLWIISTADIPDSSEQPNLNKINNYFLPDFNKIDKADYEDSLRFVTISHIKANSFAILKNKENNI